MCREKDIECVSKKTRRRGRSPGPLLPFAHNGPPLESSKSFWAVKGLLVTITIQAQSFKDSQS